jgi:hypothetical protein
LLIGHEGLAGKDEAEDDKNDIKIADCEDFFFVNYADRGAVSPYSANFIVNIATAETANTY